MVSKPSLPDRPWIGCLVIGVLRGPIPTWSGEVLAIHESDSRTLANTAFALPRVPFQTDA